MQLSLTTSFPSYLPHSLLVTAHSFRLFVLADEIEYFCRPTLLYWLVNHSDAEQRKILLKILLNVIAHDSGAEKEKPSWSLSSKVSPQSADEVVVIGPGGLEDA